MYFNWRIYLRLAQLSFSDWMRKRIPHPVKRLVFLILFFTFYPVAWLLLAVCFLLDDLFFPGYRKVRLEAPVFVIGNPRSGTTLMHRLMAKDQEHFFCFRTWEILFPSIVQKKAIALLGRADRATGGHVRRSIERFEAKRFGDFEKIHKIGLFLPEEDDKLFLHVLACVDLAWFFPCKVIDELVMFDRDVNPRLRTSLMRYYTGCLKRQTYFRGGGRRLISKNPAFSGKVDSLRAQFPDCKIICMVRNPLEVVPSTMNLGREIWRSTIRDGGEDIWWTKIYEFLRLYYSYPLERLDKVPEDAQMVVKYEDLVRNPAQVINSAYRRLGIPMTSAFSEVLESENAKSRAYKSRHHYSLEDCPVSKEQILEDLAPVFERFAFDTGNETEPAPLPGARAGA